MPHSLSALTLLAVASTSAAAADPGRVYFGGYTGPGTGGKGIYTATFDKATGTLTQPELAVAVGSPSFLCPAPDGKTLYAVGESDGKDADGGPVYAYRIDPATGKLTLLNQLTSGGSGPCHVAVDAKGEFAVVANYGGGSCAVFKLAADGRLAERTAFVQHKGSVALPERQGGPHAHCGAFDPTGNTVLVSDLGLDKLLVYQLDRATGKLTPRPPVVLPPGSGPRHFELSPKADFAVVCGEIDSTVNLVTLDLAAGTSAVTQSLSTLPAPVKGNSTAECRLHPSGKFVYVSNRGHNSIAAFKLDAGKLTAIGHATEGIKIPRNFNFDPSGEFLLVANQDGNSVVVFKLGADGVPTPTGAKIDVPAPVCIKFVATKG